MLGFMPNARTFLRPLQSALVLAALAGAPAQAAWQPPDPADTGGVQAVDNGGTPTPDPALWPPAPAAAPQVPVPDPLGGLLQLHTPPLPEAEPLLPATTTVVPGTVARLRTDGRAAIPRGAPRRVRRLIAQYNAIVGKRYRWGGGHRLVDDRAYDCSGAVGYGFIKIGMLETTMVSGSFARWETSGPGRWVTVYANRSHVYAEVAGLRLDTSPYGDPAGASGVHWRPLVGVRRGFKVRHPAGL